MVAAVTQAASKYLPNTRPSLRPQEEQQQPKTPFQNQSVPSEKDNDVFPRRPRARQVSSRYMSPSPSTSTSTSSTNSSYSSSRRCASPLVTRSTNLTSASTPLPSMGPKRAQSVDRRRPATPRSMIVDLKQSNAGEVSAVSKLLTTSSRSLSVSFQGESFSLPISKTKTAVLPNTSSVRKVTPERRRSTPIRGKGDGNADQVENSKPVDQHRWPGRTRQVNLGPNLLGRSLDCSGDMRKLCGIGSGNVIRTLRQSVVDESRRASFDGRLSLDLGNAGFSKVVQQNSNESSAASDLTPSDNDSVSSGSTAGMQDFDESGKGRIGSRGIVSSSKFWQETNSRMRRFHDPGSPLSTSPGSRLAGPSKFAQAKKVATDSPLSFPRTMSSPVRPATRPASPSKLWTSSSPSPSRGISSPSRGRNAANVSLTSNLSNPLSILSFAVDIRRGKMGEDRIVDAHTLRILYNCYLQWRFVNARADYSLLMQRLNAEKNLWNAWVIISELRHSVTLKRIKFFLLRKKLKLTSILKGQMHYLEEWALLERDHSSSLLGATESLEASILRLPVVGKAVVDIQSLKDAMSSSVDVMQAMASSICSLVSKVEEMNGVVAELAKVTSQERILVHQCNDFLSILATMQVKDCSLTTHILQLSRVETS